MDTRPIFQVLPGGSRPAKATGRLQIHIADFLQAKRHRWRAKTHRSYTAILRRYQANVGPDD